MGLKTEFVIQAFAVEKRGKLRAGEPQIVTDRIRALNVAERLSGTYAGVVVMEQHVDRDLDLFNEATVIFKHGLLPAGAFEDIADATDEQRAA